MSNIAQYQAISHEMFFGAASKNMFAKLARPGSDERLAVAQTSTIPPCMIQEICSWVEQYNLKTQGSIANWWSNDSPQTINRANCFYWMFVDKVCLHNYMCEPSKNGQNSKTKLLLVNFRCKPFKNLQKLFWTNPSPVANATARWWTLGFQPRAAKDHLSSETQGAFVWTYPWTTGPLEQGAMGTGNLEVGSGGNLWGWKWMENDGNRRVFFWWYVAIGGLQGLEGDEC